MEYYYMDIIKLKMKRCIYSKPMKREYQEKNMESDLINPSKVPACNDLKADIKQRHD